MSDLELTMMRRVGELNKEVARLKAEVEELKSQPDPLTAYLYADTLRRDDIKTLKAHIERLTKAGDEMLSEWASGEEKDAKNFLKALVIWNAAKEGKPQS
jgi:predicted RNase H-like nuclease (RuvC/YqgF family)